VKVLKTEDVLPIIGRLQDKHNYRKAINGDFIMYAFQCDLCHFWNIQQRDPGREDPMDAFLLITIR
jgi:transposase